MAEQIIELVRDLQAHIAESVGRLDLDSGVLVDGMILVTRGSTEIGADNDARKQIVVVSIRLKLNSFKA
jgi:hypothetical protein